MSLTGIHLLLTYRCTYECDHCFVWGSPDQPGTMTLKQILRLLDDAVELGTVNRIYFEGGEPTMLYPILIRAAQEARARGLEFGLVTNCYWAETPEDAEVWLAPIKDLAISDLSLSYYPYSGEDADVTPLRNTIIAAQRLDIPFGLLEVDKPAAFADLGIESQGCSAVCYKGRAAEKLGPDKASRKPETLTTCPYEDFENPGRIHVGTDGEAQMCQGISMGNILEQPLKQVVGNYSPGNMPVVAAILSGGPWKLAKTYGVQPERELHADECHFCYEVRLKLRERFPKILTPDPSYGVCG